ncbi:hypothetical protein NDU88_006431 [Pleurodeles waltl]|uniref:Uncharacterized protein n=1 Tax=Pleurodeles waltl TaxID=8319 RepID=A0AAV7X449_PLEWA|nr:hypothetical protein NDU88_006431 [Pleurodeles waltl]
MYRPQHYNTPICQLFRGGTNAIKSTAETVHRRETTHLSTLKEEPQRHGARAALFPNAGVPSHTPGTRTPAKMTTDFTCSLGWLPNEGAAAGSGAAGSGAGGGAGDGAGRCAVGSAVSSGGSLGPSPAASDGCPLGLLLLAGVLLAARQVAVLAAVVVAVLAAMVVAVLAVVVVAVMATVVVASRPSPVASDGCSAMAGVVRPFLPLADGGASLLLPAGVFFLHLLAGGASFPLMAVVPFLPLLGGGPFLALAGRCWHTGWAGECLLGASNPCSS